MDPTSLAPIFVHANPTSLTPLKSAYAVHRMAVLALSCISERKGGHWAKLPTMLVFHRVSVSLLANPSLFLARYLVYNLRKRGGNSADKYFKLTEMIAGVKDEVPSVDATCFALAGDQEGGQDGVDE